MFAMETAFFISPQMEPGDGPRSRLDSFHGDEPPEPPKRRIRQRLTSRSLGHRRGVSIVVPRPNQGTERLL